MKKTKPKKPRKCKHSISRVVFDEVYGRFLRKHKCKLLPQYEVSDKKFNEIPKLAITKKLTFDEYKTCSDPYNTNCMKHEPR